MKKITDFIGALIGILIMLVGASLLILVVAIIWMRVFGVIM